jgi:hypothetical protein
MKAQIVEQIELFSEAELESLEFVPEELEAIEAERVPDLDSISFEDIAEGLEAAFEQYLEGFLFLKGLLGLKTRLKTRPTTPPRPPTPTTPPSPPRKPRPRPGQSPPPTPPSPSPRSTF